MKNAARKVVEALELIKEDTKQKGGSWQETRDRFIESLKEESGDDELIDFAEFVAWFDGYEFD